MITDAYNTVTVTAAALASGSSVFSTDAVDMRSDPKIASNAGDLGEGMPIYATLWVSSTFTGAGASAQIDIGFATASDGTGFSAIASTGTLAVASLPVGLPGSSGSSIHGYLLSTTIQPLRNGNYNPYLMARITASGAAVTGAAKVMVTLEPIDGRVFYPSGFTVL